MEENNNFEDLFEQLADLLRFIQEKAGTPIDESKITPDIKQRLEKLQKDIQTFTQLSNQVVALSGVSREEIDKRLEGKSEDISPEGRQMIEKAKKLHTKAAEMKQTFAPGPSTLKPLPESPPPQKPLDDKTFRKRRRRKFKHLDEDRA